MIDCTEWARNPHTRAAPHTSKLSDCVSKRLCVFNQVLEAVRILDDTVYLLHTKQRQACCPGFSALRDVSWAWSRAAGRARVRLGGVWPTPAHIAATPQQSVLDHTSTYSAERQGCMHRTMCCLCCVIVIFESNFLKYSNLEQFHFTTTRTHTTDDIAYTQKERMT